MGRRNADIEMGVCRGPWEGTRRRVAIVAPSVLSESVRRIWLSGISKGKGSLGSFDCGLDWRVLRYVRGDMYMRNDWDGVRR